MPHLFSLAKLNWKLSLPVVTGCFNFLTILAAEFHTSFSFFSKEIHNRLEVRTDQFRTDWHTDKFFTSSQHIPWIHCYKKTIRIQTSPILYLYSGKIFSLLCIKVGNTNSKYRVVQCLHHSSQTSQIDLDLIAETVIKFVFAHY